jgi:SAM-dependent methyltransferase
VIAEAIRRVRAAAYWVAGPADSLWRHATGRASLPPLWLRRHTGPLRAFESAARETAEFLDRLGLLRGEETVLDVGCGAGAMVPELARRLGPTGRYIGFDVHAPSIRWCRKRYASDPRLRFELADVASAYSASSGAPASSYRFPVADGAADLVLAKSVFTHLLETDARHYLDEIRRVLTPGRGAVVTAFLFDDSGASPSGVARAFPHEEAPGGARLRSRARPTAAVAWGRSRFERMVSAAGLRVVWFSPGYFPGGPQPAGQDSLLLGH